MDKFCLEGHSLPWSLSNVCQILWCDWSSMKRAQCTDIETHLMPEALSGAIVKMLPLLKCISLSQWQSTKLKQIRRTLVCLHIFGWWVVIN